MKALRILSLLLIASHQLSVSATFASARLIDAADFGLAELASGDDATPIFRRAVEACKQQNADGLIIPTGAWHLYPDYAFEENLAVANNNPGVKRVAFLLSGMKDFSLIGKDAHLVCHGQLIPISADEATALTLKGFSIDWANPFHFQGEVIALHPELNAFDLRVHEEVVYEVRGQRLIFREKPSPTPNTWKEWAPPTTERMAWEHNLQWNMWFDGNTKHPIPGEHQWALEPDPQVQEVAAGVIRIFDAVRLMPNVGWVLTVKGMVSPNRTSPAIRIARSKDLHIEDVTIHHAGGMGIIVQRTDGATLRNVNVTLPPDSGRLVTTTADATHFNGCRGDILLEDCTFENMLDDATNIHGCFVRIERLIGDKTLICRRIHSQQRGLIVMEAGDEVRFLTSGNLQPYADASVVSTRELNSDLFEVTLNQLPADGVREASALYNTTWQPKLTIRSCTVRNNRARTMLIATAGDVLIEDSTFEHSSMAGIQFEGDNGFWWESGPTRNVLIRRNLFRNNAGAVLRVAPQIDATRYPDALYHGGITFEQNKIETFHRLIVEGLAIDGLDFRSNTIEMTDFAPTPDTASPSFKIASGRNIMIQHNNFSDDPPLKVQVGHESPRPTLVGNRGVILEGR